MSKAVFDLFPNHITSRSISSLEIVLPLREALEAVDILEEKGKLILGWDSWIKTKDGRVGHGSAPQGSVSLETLSIHEAAEVCRNTLPQAANLWRIENEGSTDELHFCITVHI